MARLIDGKQLSAQVLDQVASEVQQLKAEQGITPALAVVLVGEDPASQVYVRNKVRRAEEAGIRSIEHRLSADTDQQTLNALVEQLNQDPEVHGILVQLPLPAQLDEAQIIAAINPAKDVDGFHPLNVGALASGQVGLVPCTPLGCMIMLQQVHEDLSVRMRDLLPASPFLNFAWTPIGALVVLVFAAVYLPFLRRLQSEVAKPMFLAGVVYLSGALVVETAGGWLDFHAGRNQLYHFTSAIEESLEMLGMAVFSYALLRHIETVLKPMMFKIK